MGDRRHLQRYILDIPAMITNIPNDCECPERLLMTRDISAAGAFFDTRQPLPQGTILGLELRFPGRDRPRGRVQLHGTVVRSTPIGMAVTFDNDYRFLAVRDTEKNVEN